MSMRSVQSLQEWHVGAKYRTGGTIFLILEEQLRFSGGNGGAYFPIICVHCDAVLERVRGGQKIQKHVKNKAEEKCESPRVQVAG